VNAAGGLARIGVVVSEATIGRRSESAGRGHDARLRQFDVLKNGMKRTVS